MSSHWIVFISSIIIILSLFVASAMRSKTRRIPLQTDGYRMYHIGLTGKIYFEFTPMSCRMYNFLISGKHDCDWIRHRERERLGYHKCYSN